MPWKSQRLTSLYSDDSSVTRSRSLALATSLGFYTTIRYLLGVEKTQSRFVPTALGHLVSFMLIGSGIVVSGSEPMLLGPHPPDSTLISGPVQIVLYP